MLNYWAMFDENIKFLRENVKEAALISNRCPEDITIVVVTKGITADLVQKAVESGLNEIGENRVQEAGTKVDLLKGLNINWHMVGHLQTNKVKYAVEMFDYLHSLDSLKLAHELEKNLLRKNKVMKVFIEVNISGEVRKFGINPNEADEMVNEVLKLPHLDLMGFMTVAPVVENAEDCRPYFKELKNLSEDLGERFNRKFYLSMGMSDDFQTAIEEGADFIRIGRAVFKERL